MARKTLLTQTIADEICTRIALGESLRKITQDDHLPGLSTVQRWLASAAADSPDHNPNQNTANQGNADLYANFRDQYARARQQQADIYGDRVLEVAELAVSEVLNAATDTKAANAMVQARRLQMDALRWTAGQLAPKRWGTSHKSTDSTTHRADHEAAMNKARDRVQSQKAATLHPIDGGKAGKAGK